MTQPVAMNENVKLPWRVDGLHGYRSSQGPTYNGGHFFGGGPQSERSVTVRVLTPMGRPATVELDLCDDQHGCTVTLNPETARQLAGALSAGAAKAEADMARWREVLERQRAEIVAAQQRDLIGRAGLPKPTEGM